MKAGWTISAVLHAAVLAWGLITFATKPLERAAAGIPADRHHLGRPTSRRSRRACKTAPKAEAPKPLVEKIAEAKPVENPTAKVVEKPEIVPTADQAQPPSPSRQKKAEPKPPTPKPQAKPEPKQAFAKEPEPKVDPIAEALKKDTKKPETEDSRRRPRRRRRRRRPSRRSRSRSSTPAASRRCSTSATRSATPRPASTLEQHARRSAPRPGTAVDAVAERDRRAARALAAMLERAGRPRRGARPGRDGAHPVQAGRHRCSAEPRVLEPRQPSGLPGRGRKRVARDAPLRALQLPAGGQIRGLEGRRSSISIHATCSAADAPFTTWEHEDVMTITLRSPFGFTRRRVLALGAAASASAARAAGAGADRVSTSRRATSQPLPIAIPDFVGGTPGDAEVARGITPGHHRQPAALRPVRADRSGGLSSRRSPASTCCRAFPTGARSTRRR